MKLWNPGTQKSDEAFLRPAGERSAEILDFIRQMSGPDGMEKNDDAEQQRDGLTSPS